jgi:hypothetical protein
MSFIFAAIVLYFVIGVPIIAAVYWPYVIWRAWKRA